ncbi:MAG: NYN domain-containing protein [Gemmatimonadaceae bacterium]|nr:NYN domain-containing protein [Gemmatimonadaceae bacterium]
MTTKTNELTRIGVFYDGTFFFHASNYYNYHHDRRARLSVGGLHEFVRSQAADSEGVDVRYCQIVDAHYFRGRPRAQDAEQRGMLARERAFDDVLVREGVVTHYLPLGPDGEKGIDVWLALEAYELAIYKRFDVVVLVACDGDFLPLVRKLNTIGTRVMLLAWDFKFTDADNKEQETRTAQVLLDEVTYPIMMHQIIDDRSRRADPLVNGMFVPPRPVRAHPATNGTSPVVPTQAELPQQTGRIQNLQPGYGFIAPDSGAANIFFFHAELLNADFNELRTGQRVTYALGSNKRGPCAISISVLDRPAAVGAAAA